MVRTKTYPADLRDRLVAEASDLLRRQGPDDLRLRSLAATCGTSTNAVYTMFGSKEALVDEVTRVAREDFLRPQRQLLTREPSIAALRASGEVYRAWAHANPGLYRLLFAWPTGRPEPSHQVPGPIREMLEPIRALLVRLQEHDLVLPHDADAMSMSLWASTHGFVVLEMGVCLQGMDADALYDAHLATCVAGILKPSASA